MSKKQQIQQDLNKAIKEGDMLLTSVLRMLSAAILNKEKEKRYKLSKEEVEDLEKESQLTDEEVLEVLSAEAKKRKEAISEYEKGGREDLAAKEKEELEVLQRYLPEQLSEEEIKKLVQEAIKKTDAKEPKDMGKVMAQLMPQVKGRADGALVSKIVKELLTSQND